MRSSRPPRSESGRSWTYHLTPSGREFEPLLQALGVWGQRWSRRTLAKHEANLTLLIWALELHVVPQAFGARRCVVRMTFTDQPEATKHWWFVNEDGHVEICVQDPGFEVDLYLASTLRDMIYIYRGDLPMSRAASSAWVNTPPPLADSSTNWSRAPSGRYTATSLT